jgi:hypothetical protein
MTAATVVALIRPTARAMRWGPFAIAAGLGLAVLMLPESLSDRLTATALATLLRIAAACAAIGVAFLLDDPASRSTPTVPTSRLVRQALRAAIALLAMTAWWAVALVTTAFMTTAALPRGALTVEAAGMAAVALGLAAGLLRFTTEGSSGTLAAPALLIVLAITWFAPHRVGFILAPADPHWTAAHRRWAGLLIVAVVTFLWASHESAARGRRGRF